jgi:single-stranded-DNA-specific exonuclease
MIGSRAIRLREVPVGLKGDFPDNFHPVIRRILLSRGISKAEETSLELKDMLLPDELAGVDGAASLLASAVTEDRKILIVGDFDTDGATGTALAVLSLRAMGCRQVEFRVPNRFEFGYGLTVPLVDTLAGEPPDLLVTVDSGISCIAGVERARQLGCQVIVTDHHLPGPDIPAADAIVNPNCEGDSFPSKAMAGVGVMFYLLSVLRRKLRERDWFRGSRKEPNLAHFLDLVALGTVADLVPLDRNNRVLVRQGLERIRRGMARPGLLALLRLGKRDYRYAGASDLGFAVGPRLNAAGRLEDMSTGIRCLLAEEPQEAAEMAQQLDELNLRRRSLQEQMQQDAIEKVNGLLATLEQGSLPLAVCLFDDAWHEGIVGLVASRVKDRTRRPAIVFAPESGSDEFLKGSARSVKGLHIRDVLAYMDSHQPGLITAFGGHAMAAGLTLPRERLGQFEDTLSEAVTAVLDGATLVDDLVTDGELSARDLTLGFASQLEQMGPWGQKFPEPLFDGRFRVISSRVVGGSHLKMVVQSLDGSEPLDAIAFNRLPEDLPESDSVRLLYRLEINRWRGNESCQLRVEELPG